MTDIDYSRVRGCVPDKDVLGKLGEGAYGAVFKVVKNGKTYALKTYDPSRALSTDNLIEIDVLVRVKHPYVLNAESASLRDCGICLMLPLAGSDLDKWIDANPLDIKATLANQDRMIDRRMAVFYKAMCGLSYLHLNHIVHQDIKPANILMVGDDPKLADFGLASVFPHDRIRYTRPIVTWAWRAPELLAEESTYTSNIDVWAMGIILYTMLTDEELIVTPSENDDEPPADKILLEIARKIGPLSPSQTRGLSSEVLRLGATEHSTVMNKVPAAYRSLLMKMLERNPRKRASAQDVVNHSMFSRFKCVTTKIEVLPFNINPSDRYLAIRSTLLKQARTIVNQADYGIETFFLAADILDRYATVRPDHPITDSDMYISVYLAAGIYMMGVNTLRKVILVKYNSFYSTFTSYLGGSTAEERFNNAVCDVVAALNFRIFRPTIDLQFPGVDSESLAKCVIDGLTPSAILCAEGKRGTGRKNKERQTPISAKKKGRV